jgi:hypothetical protein
LVKTVPEHSSMCRNFVSNLVQAHPDIVHGERRVVLIVENDSGAWPVDGFIRDLRLSLQRLAPNVSVHAAHKVVTSRNESTGARERRVQYGVNTNNQSKVRGVQYTRIMLCCGTIRFHEDFFSDGSGAARQCHLDAQRAHTMFFEQLARFAPNKVTMRNGAVKSISYSGMKDVGVKADDICMTWLVFIVASLEMFDQRRYFDQRCLVPSDTPALVQQVRTRMLEFVEGK